MRAIGSEVTGASEAADVTGLQRDCQRQDLPDAADGLEPLEVLAQLDLGQDAALKLVNLAVDAVHHHQVLLHGLLVLVEQLHGVDALGIPAFDVVAADARAEVESALPPAVRAANRQLWVGMSLRVRQLRRLPAVIDIQVIGY
jgi:hypothetical protein